MKCKTTTGCAPYAKLCDGVLDCADASDENITVCDELKYHKETALLKSKCQAKDQVYIYFSNYKWNHLGKVLKNSRDTGNN